VLQAQQPQGEVPSHECCLELLLPVGARSVALGASLGARTVVAAPFDNPASLAPMDSDAFVIYDLSGSVTPTDAFSLVIAPHHIGSFGLSYLLADYGDIGSTDATGRQIGSVSVRTHIFVGSFAAALEPWLMAGVNYTVYLQHIHCSGQCAGSDQSSSTQTVDLGVRYQAPGVRGLELGATLAHLGLPLQVNNAAQSDPPPTRLHLSAAYEVLQRLHVDPSLAFWLTVEAIERVPLSGAPVAGVGGELSSSGVVFLRGGYAGGSAGCGSGPSVGVGLHYTRFRAAVAKSYSACSFEPGQQAVQVTFQVRF
jgi:hypothetical protein